ncbi:MAG: tol-pal system protein YbgF [bacterium]|jgi:tol-pal system protein YbgF
MIRRRLLVLLFLFAGILLLCGCYGKKIYELETQAARQERVIEALEDSLAMSRRAIADLDSLVGRESVPYRTRRADMGTRMDELQTRVEILESLVKENRYRISQATLRGGAGAGVGAGIGAGAATPAGEDSVMMQASLAQHLFETAYVDFTKGDFESAIAGFSDFVSGFPMTDFSDDAQFMIGRSHFLLGDYDDAIVEFRKVLDNYPSGDRVPPAMYNLGLCYIEIDDIETAREYFKIVVSRYPTTMEAREAQSTLSTLPPPPPPEEED